MKTLLIFGDSIIRGDCDTQGGWADRVKRFTDEKSITTPNSTTKTYVLGISGETTEGLLNRFESEARRRIDPEMPTVTILAIGINDSQVDIKNYHNKIPHEEFQMNLKNIIEKAKKISESVILLSLTPVDEGRVNPIPWKPTHGYINSEITRYNAILKKSAFSENIGFINIYTEFIKRNYTGLLFDGLHPTTEGHELMFTIIKDYLLKKEII